MLSVSSHWLTNICWIRPVFCNLVRISFSVVIIQLYFLSVRHAVYKTQYRTLFTFNCTVDESEVLYLASDAVDLVSAVDKKAQPHRVQDSDAVFHRVKCEVCKTPVGVQDSEGVYHLFEVLVGHS